MLMRRLSVYYHRELSTELECKLIKLKHLKWLLSKEISDLLQNKKQTRPDASYNTIKALYHKLSTIDHTYNTEDGQIRWLLDNNFDVHLAHFWGILPQETRATMKQWKKMDMSLKQAVEIRGELSTIDKKYNTEDGQIRWLLDNTIDVNLGKFWTILPQETRATMKQWKKMDMSLKQAVAIREKLSTIDHTYNTEDGQIRWLLDNTIDVHLGHFWGILPQQIKIKMTQWSYMNMPLKQAVAIRKKLSSIDKKYNTEDGQIRWLQDNKYNVHLGQFWSVIPQEVREKMTQWGYMNMPLKQAIEIRGKLSTIDKKYNTEDGQMHWLQDNKYNIHLGQFWGIIPRQVRKKMKRWEKIDMPLKQAVAIRKKLSSIDRKYNTKDGQIRWLQDNKYNVHLGQFWSVLPQEVRKKMTQWSYMNIPLEDAIVALQMSDETY
ncbi:hypothetical protein KBB05_00505 [Patescibacteria group bacterium]|nr:hypothetical protein [Patescibacteria group bacterium]